MSVAKSSGRWLLTLSDTIGASTSEDAAGAGRNGLDVNQVVYLEGITVTLSADQAVVDAYLNGRVHEVKTVSGATVTLHTTGGSVTGTVAASAGEIHTVRYNYDDTYSTPDGVTPYDSTVTRRPDDPDALTAWRVVVPIDKNDTLKPCYPAWVANRQRDYDDRGVRFTEGWMIRGDPASGANGDRGISRRESLPIPYRLNPECAEDRIVLGAPGYGCMFQIPLHVPTNPSDWPNSPSNGDFGLPVQSNGIYDKPRSLGVPKARLVEPASYLGSPAFSLGTAAASPEFGFPAGTYQIAISYEDEGTGEEGLASETQSITVADGGTTEAYAIVVNYVHPGYVMSECLALKLNVYISAPGDDALSFYASFPLGSKTTTYALSGSTYQDRSDYRSSNYGFASRSSPDRISLWAGIQLPLPGDGTAISDNLNGLRLAPQSASMPRGADACRMIRGVLLSGGSVGNTGPALELWKSKASSIYDPSFGWNDKNGFQIISYETSFLSPADGGKYDSALGIAGRVFPDAYQGIEAISRGLFPAGKQYGRVDYVGNRIAASTSDGSVFADNIRLVDDVWSRTSNIGTPSVASATNRAQDIYYVMPKGQLQIHDPGAPGRASKAAIQFIDANKGDDITAIGHLSGNAIICSRRETFSYSWRINPSGEVPNLISTEHGCIGANTMIEFDGGLAWISERGPIAIGNGIQFIGMELTADFYGDTRRYKTDSRGMMRHAWGCHDPSRGIVMWGLVTSQNTATMTKENVSYTWTTADDKLKSRWPCDEVLIWNYRADAFSTWRPPTGYEVVWMRPLRDLEGQMRTCFMTKDGCIYALDDFAGKNVAIGCSPVAWLSDYSGPGASSLNPIEVGDLIEQIHADGRLIAEATVTAVSAGGVPTIDTPLTYVKNSQLLTHRRPRATILSTYSGGSTMDNLNVQGAHMRYSIFGYSGEATDVDFSAQVNTKLYASDLESKSAVVNPSDAWVYLGPAVFSSANGAAEYIARRRAIKQGGIDAPEVALQLEISGSAQVRIVDLGLEVG